MTSVRIYPETFGTETTKHRHRWNVILHGEMVLTGSRDPEHDVARVLLGRGIIGRVDILDGRTGVVRTRVDIERAAGYCMVEESKGGLRVRTVAPDPDISCQTAAKDSAATPVPAAAQQPSDTKWWPTSGA